MAQGRVKPKLTAQAIVSCLQTYDVGGPEGKRALWRVLAPLGVGGKRFFAALRDLYLEVGFSVSESNRLAALDFASTLPTASEVGSGILDRMRPGGVDDGRSSASLLGKLDGVKGDDYPWLRGKGIAGSSEGSGVGEAAGSKGGIGSGLPTETLVDRLMTIISERGDRDGGGMSGAVSWVSANLRRRLDSVDADDIPSLETLNLWLWAKSNETAFRQLYDCKRIPQRGFGGNDVGGFIDDGSPIADIMAALRRIGHEGGVEDVSVPVMSEAESGGCSGSVAGEGGSSGGVSSLSQSVA